VALLHLLACICVENDGDFCDDDCGLARKRRLGGKLVRALQQSIFSAQNYHFRGKYANFTLMNTHIHEEIKYGISSTKNTLLSKRHQTKTIFIFSSSL